MKIVLQRVTSASVTVEGEVVGRIDAGLLALVGVRVGDTPAQARSLAAKAYTLRILEGERSAHDLEAPLLVVSQFTLYADTGKGRRPSWNAAAKGPEAEPLIEEFCTELRRLGARVETGRFGADMQVALVNDGPFTIVLEG